MKKLTAIILGIVMTVGLVIPGWAEGWNPADAAQETTVAAQEATDFAPGSGDLPLDNIFADWDMDAPALNYLIDYVESVTDESSSDFIPEWDRIAVFDMDGTLYAELFPTYLEYYLLAWRILKDPTFEPDAQLLELGREIRESAITHSFARDMPMRHALGAAKAYSGMTLKEFSDFVKERLEQEADGFEGMSYGEAFYLPMLEVIEYLLDNDFIIYIITGSDRFIFRTLLEDVFNFPKANIIGMDVAVEASGQGTTDGIDYVYTSEDNIIRTDRLLIKNLKMNKVCQIIRDIGEQPVLSFGNSSGDVSMHNYTIFNNPYKSAAFMLIADNEELDYGNTEKAQKLREEWEADGYHVISMKDDWTTIYGGDVHKTGSFHWEEELSENRTPKDAALPAEQENETGAPEEDVQYVMFLGTNDKDTNQPVFSPDEAKVKTKEILIKHFGGYTIQEAEGGWLGDDGTLYQEYSLVIYLSDTNEEQVHAAADELVSVFRQSSVLIQTNPTKTEFYAGK